MPLNIDVQQIFLHLLNFTLLFAALYFLLYKPVKDFMAKRTAYYEEMDRQAQEKLAEAGRIQADYEQKLAQANQEIHRQSEQAQQAAIEAADLQIQQAKAEADHILAKARAEAHAEEKRIIHAARSEISEMVSAAAEKLLLPSTSAAYDQFLERAGKEDDHA